MKWIPRDLNVLADDISKLVERDDYTINDSVFSALDDLLGPHTCDRFGCHYIAKVSIFNFNGQVLSAWVIWYQRLCSGLVQQQQLALPSCLFDL